MCTYIIFFRTSLRSADSKCQISHRWCKNGSECTSLCATKVLQEVNFPKSFLSSCIQDGLWLCTYIAVFLDGVRWRHNRAPNLEPRYLVNFVSVSGRIATPIMVINDIVINTLLGRVTRHPAGMHCPTWDDAFVSSLFLFFSLSRSESGAPCVRGVHSSNTHCVAIYRPISTRLAAFFFGRDCSLRHAT